MSALERDAVCLSRLLCAEEEPALLFTGHREVKPAGSEEWPNHLTWSWRAPAPGKAYSQCVWLTARDKQNRAIAGPPRHRPGWRQHLWETRNPEGWDAEGGGRGDRDGEHM